MAAMEGALSDCALRGRVWEDPGGTKDTEFDFERGK